MSHCKACGKGDADLCSCACYDCDVVYFQHKLMRALKIPREAMRFEGDNPFSYDEDFVIKKPDGDGA